MLGIVLRAPTCPVEQANSPCPPAPAPGATVAAFGGGTELAHTTTDGTGRFRFSLPRGTYDIVATSAGPLRNSARSHVVVGATPVRVRLTVDSGIR